MRMVELFAGFGIDMYFNGNLDKELIGSISVESVLKPEEIVYILEHRCVNKCVLFLIDSNRGNGL